MKEIDITVHGKICEHPSIRLYSTGDCGGDAGHGGEAIVEFSMPDGGCGFDVQLDESRQAVSIAVRGDWELEGMVVALAELGKQLLARPDVMAARKE